MDLSAGALFNVNGIVAIVTGGGTGIGLTIAKALAANGAHKVYIVGRRKEVLEAAAKTTSPESIIPLPGDVTSLESLCEMAERVKTEVGYVNLLVANAGIMGPRPLKAAPGESPPTLSEFRAHALATPTEVFTDTFSVNTTAVYYSALAFLELLDTGNAKGNMGADWRSQVIATSSIGGYSRLKGASFAYNSSKAATTHLMKMMATSLVPYKIRCNVLAPGVFPTDLTGSFINNFGPSLPGAFDSSLIPAERAGSEPDIAGAVLFLASKAGAYCNGSVIVIDGGRLGTLPSTY
ncbi:NAD(P)-binding protein [Glonium stellatum]|uniref:NAD(P)-binding protein n=1 Tax=Glonium stellatum TaxID=574774 RepID=A0A8E2JX02_9PEZI|nr:NAD(P)-binding protein [Glonium stellatum]